MTVTHEACVIEATHLGLRDIGPWLDDVFARAGWTESPSRATTELAVHELAANVVDHARPADGVVSLSAHGEPDTLTITTVEVGLMQVTASLRDRRSGREVGRVNALRASR